MTSRIEVEYPRISLEYANENRSPFNESKVALLVENRPFPILAPLVLHFMSVVPPDWRFRFMGSIESVEHINRSVAVQEQVRAGKLDLTYIPSNMTTGSQEEISRFLTTLWLYEVVLQPAEWLLVFQTDSILCANSQRNLNDYLDYHWIGAPWNPRGRFGGNGGLSLRRVSAIIDVLRSQVRVDGSEPEDVWLAERLGHRPSSKVANGTVSLTFSGEMHSGKAAAVQDHEEKEKGRGSYEEKEKKKEGDGKEEERIAKDGTAVGRNDTSLDAARGGKLVKGLDDWRAGFYEPMGYHTGGSGVMLHGAIWGTPALRKHIWDYCPEVKMTLMMDAAKFVPGDCNAKWKRDGGLSAVATHEGETADWSTVADVGFGTEIIDGVPYPSLPPGLTPWL